MVDERRVVAPRMFEWLAWQGLRVGTYQYLTFGTFSGADSFARELINMFYAHSDLL